MKLGSTIACLWNGTCVPSFKHVYFEDANAYSDVERKPLDAPRCAASILHGQDVEPYSHSIWMDEDCVFGFDAQRDALCLQFECYYDRYEDIIEQFIHTLSDPLETVLISSDCDDRVQDSDQYHQDESWETPTYNLDGIIPEEPTIPIHLQAQWIRDLKSEWDNIQQNYPQYDPDLRVRTWYLQPGRYDRWQNWRPMSLPSSTDHWWNSIRSTWHDLLDHELAVEVHFVQPTAPRLPQDFTHPFDLIVAQGLQGDHRTALAVTQLIGAYVRMHTIAVILPPFVSRWSMIYWTQNDMFCAGPAWQVDFHRLCLVYRDQQQIQAGLEDVHQGDCFTVEIHPPTQIAEEDVDDYVNFMGRNPVIQRQPPDIIPPDNAEADHELPEHMQPGRWYTALVFVLRQNEVTGRVSSGSLDHLYTQIEEFLQIPRHHLLDLIEVHSPPRDISPTFDYIMVANRRGDIPAGSRAKLVLTDTEFCHARPALETDTVRKLRLIVTPTTKQTILHLLGLFPYCQHAPCLVKVNHDFVPQTGPFELQNGDYLHIIVGPIENCGVDTRLAAAACNSGYARHELFRLNQNIPDDVHIHNMPNNEYYLDSLPFDEQGVQLNLLQTQTEFQIFRPNIDPSLDVRQCRLNGTEEIRRTINDVMSNQPDLPTREEEAILRALDEVPAHVRDLHGYWLQAAEPWLDNEPWAPVMVWFVSTVRWRICVAPRRVWLNSNIRQWRNIMISAWNDHIDPEEAIDVLIVTPRPDPLEPGIAAHIIIAQTYGSTDENPSVVTLTDNRFPDQFDRQAMILPEYINHHLLLNVANRLQVCSDLRHGAHCTTRFGAFELNDEGMVGRPGLSYNVEVHQVFEPEQPMFPQEHSLIYPQGINTDSPEIVLQIHNAIQAQRMVEPAQPVNLQVVTWFLNHETSRRCLYGREVNLPLDPTRWIPHILSHWTDIWNANLPVEMFLVTPKPSVSQWRQGTSFHVMIHQQVKPDERSILVTTFDQTLRVDDPPGIQRAFVVPNVVSVLCLLQAAQLDDWCSAHVNRRCLAHFGAVNLDNHGPIICSHGFNFRVTLMNTLPVEWPAPLLSDTHEDANVLLQTQAVLSSTPTIDPPQRKLISLQDCLPSATTFVPCADLLFVRQQCLQFDFGQPTDSAAVVKWHEATQDALQQCPAWTHEIPIALRFYTDGSAMRHEDGWKATAAIVLIVDTDAGERFGGFHCFQVNGKATAPRAEITAIFAATLWALQLLLVLKVQYPGSCTEVGFYFDSLLAGYSASGDWRIHAHSDIQTHSRAIVQWIETRFEMSLQWHHVSAHSGHPWNEAADAISWAGLHQWIPSRPLDEYFAQLTLEGQANHLSQWLWYAEASLQGKAGFMPIDEQRRFVAHLNAPFSIPPDPLCHSLKRAEVTTRQFKQADGLLRCGTANVLTLYPTVTAHGQYISARQESLLQQFHEAQFQVVGVQETRSRSQGHSQTDTFHILSAPATAKGVGGVQLWIAKKWKSLSNPLTVTAQHLKILHTTSQQLIVRFHTETLRFLFIVAHAPDSSKLDQVQRWWDTLFQAIPNACREWPTIVLCDANARIGSIESFSVGPHQAEEENEAGAIFHQWLHDAQMIVPQTMPECHVGEGSTWQHPTGAMARIDYAAISRDLHSSEVRTKIADVDIALQKIDHLVVQIDIPISTQVSSGHGKPHIPGSTSDTLTGQSCQDDFNFSWSLDVHTHAAKLHQIIGQHVKIGPEVPRPRKQHLSASSWQLISLKKFHWKRCRQVRSHHRLAMLRVLFQAWRSPDRHTDVPYRPWLKLTDECWAFHSHQYSLLTRQAAQSVKTDDRQYYTQLAEHTGNIAADEGIGGLWKRIKQILPKQVNKRNSSMKCVGPELADIIQHYNDLEAGEPVHYESLLADVFAEQRDKVHEAPIQIDLSTLPTRLQVESHVHKAKRGKAPGIDQLSIDQVRSSLPWLSEHLLLMFLKSWMLAAEPLQYKGGILVSILKKPGNWTLANLRGIMLIESIGKIFHAMMRTSLLPWASNQRLSTQYGGFKGQQTAHAALHLRTFMNIAKTKRISCAVIFVDLKSAFHSMLREHAFGSEPAFSDRLRSVLRAEGFDPDALQNLSNSHAAGFEAHPQPALIRLIQDAHRGTWFHVPPTNNCQRTWRGSRPGSPIADIAFNILMTAVLRQINHDLQDIPSIQWAQSRLDIPIPLVAWVDDIALPIPFEKPDQLQLLMRQVMTLMQAVFASFGLTLNMSKGKTEALCQLRGPKAAETRRQFFIHDFATIEVGLPQPIRLVTHYKHLGILVGQNLSLDQDISQRIGRATTAFRTLTRPLFTNRVIPVNVRLQLLEALVLPSIFYGCGAWPLLTHKQFRMLAHKIMGWQRVIIGTGYWSTQNWTDDHLRARWKLMDLSVRLAKHRLLYAMQLHQQAPPDLWNSIVQEDDLCTQSTTWITAAKHALKWYEQMCPHPEFFEALPPGTPRLLAWLARADEREPRRVRQAVRVHLSQEYAIFQAVQGHFDILQECKLKGVQTDDGDDRMASRKQAHQCHLCAKSFPSIQGLNAHLWSQHQHISLERRYVFSDTCLACGRCFWTPQRMQQHLRYSRQYEGGCLEFLVKHYSPLDHPVRFDVPEPHAHIHRLPWVYAEGPIPDDLEPLWDVQQKQRIQKVRAQWIENGFPQTLQPACKTATFDALSTITHNWIDQPDDADLLVHDWLSYIEHFDGPVDDAPLHAQWAFLEWGQTAMYDLLEAIEDPDIIIAVEHAFLSVYNIMPMWPLLQEFDRIRHAYPPAGPNLDFYKPVQDLRLKALIEPFPDSLRDQDYLLKGFVGQQPCAWPLIRGVPLLQFPDGRQVLVVFHLFSGRRRPNDCHDCFHTLMPSYFPGIDIFVCSLDTAVDEKLCDLAQGPFLPRLLAIARKGIPALCMTGPPCETWTAARHLKPPAGSNQRWPRPLRSAQQPWGIAHRTCRELTQLAIGTQLMMTSNRLELMIYLGGGGSIKEHPAEPRSPDYSSIWRTNLHRNLLLAAPGADLVYLEQWKYGADAVKPTHLSVLGLPNARKKLMQSTLDDAQRPTSVLQGVDDTTGLFRTARAKEYPSGLCKALVISSLNGLRQRVAAEGWKVIPSSSLGEQEHVWLRDVVEAGNHCSTTSFLPDYQPRPV